MMLLQQYGLIGISGAATRDEALAAAVWALKSTALALDIVVVVTAHLPHWTRGRTDPRPAIEDFGARSTP